MTKEILFAPFEFALLKCNSSNYVNISKCHALLVIREVDFHTVGKELININAYVAGAHATFTAVVEDAQKDLYNQGKNEYEITGTIQGFEVLNLNTMEKCWVSHFDMKFLLESQ